MRIALLWLWSPALAILCGVVLIWMVFTKVLRNRPRDWRWFLLPAVPLALLLVAGMFLMMEMRGLAHM